MKKGVGYKAAILQFYGRLRAVNTDAERTVRDILIQNGEGEHADLYDLEGTQSSADPRLQYNYGKMQLSYLLLSELEQLAPELKAGSPTERPGVTYQALLKLLEDGVAGVDPDRHVGCYHQLAEGVLIPLVNRALRFLGLDGLTATGWHPNDHWTDGIIVTGQCMVNGRLNRIPDLVLGDLVDCTGEQDAPTKEDGVREVAEQLWFLRRVSQGQITIHSWDEFIDDDTDRFIVPLAAKAL